VIDLGNAPLIRVTVTALGVGVGRGISFFAAEIAAETLRGESRFVSRLSSFMMRSTRVSASPAS